MRTTSLAKAPVGHICYVISPNQIGYDELVNMEVGKIKLQELIDGLKSGIKENKEENSRLKDELQKAYKLINSQEDKIDSILEELKKIKLENIEIVKGLISR